MLGLQRSYARTGAQLKTIGGNLTQAITLPIVGIAAAAVKSGLDFERAMNQIQGVMRPTAAQMDAVRVTALKMGADTIFSATDAATAMLELGKAGFSVTDSMSAVGNVLQLAAASGLTMGAAAELSARTIKSFGLETGDLAHVNDVLAQAVNSSTLEIDDLRTAFAYVGPIATGFGISLEQVSAALAVMRDNGIQAETAGRALREGLGRLANPVKAVRDVMAEMNIDSFKDASGQLMGLSDIVGILEQHGLTAAQSLKLFGDAAGPGMFALVSKGKSALDGLTVGLQLSGGAAKAMGDAMMQGLPGAMEQLKGSIDTALIGISKAMEPALIPLLNLLTRIANVVSTVLVPAFSALPLPVQMAAMGMLALAAAAGPVLYIIGSLFSASSSLIGGWRILFGSLAKDGTRSVGLLSGAFTALSAVMTRLAVVDAAITARGMVALNAATTVLGQSSLVMGTRMAASSIATAASGAAARIAAISQAALTSAMNFLNASAAVTTVRVAASGVATAVVGVASRVASVGIGVLSGAYVFLRTAIAALMGPLGLFIGALYAVNQAANSETFLKWASTSDGMAASLVRAASGHRQLSAAEFETAFAAKQAKEAHEQQATGMQAVIERARQIKTQMSEASVQVQALTRVLNELTAVPVLDPREAQESGRVMQEIGRQAAALKASGQQLTPELERVVAQFLEMGKTGTTAAEGISAVDEEAKAATERIKTLNEQFSGTADIRAGNEMAKSLVGVDVKGQSWDVKESINKTMDTAIKALKRRKEAIPKAIQSLFDATASTKIDMSQLIEFDYVDVDGNLVANSAKLETAMENDMAMAEGVAKAYADVGSKVDMSGLLFGDAKVAAEHDKAKAFQEDLDAMGASLQSLEDKAKEVRHGELMNLGASFQSLGQSIGGASGQVVSGVGDIIQAFADYDRHKGETFSTTAKVGAAVAGAAAVWQATRSGTRNEKMLSGAMTGLSAGMNPALMSATSGASAAIGLVGGAMVGGMGPTHSAEELKQAREMAETWQESMVDAFDETATGMQRFTAAGDDAHKIQILIADQFQDMGIDSHVAAMMLAEVGQAQKKGPDAVADVLDKINDLMAQHAKIVKNWAEGVGMFVEGFTTRVEGFSALIKRIHDGADEMNKAKAAGQDTRQMALELHEATERAGLSFRRMGDYAAIAFTTVLGQTGSIIQAIRAINEPLEELIALQKEFGFEGSAAFGRIAEISGIISANEDLFISLDGLNQMMAGLQKATLLTSGDLALFGQDATAIFGEMTGRGIDANLALALMQPTLQALWEGQQKFGQFTDAGTQALIDQAVAAGIVGEGQRDVNIRLLEAVLGVNTALGSVETAIGGVELAIRLLPQAFADATLAAQALADTVGRIPRADNSTPTGNVAVARPTVQSFASEGIVRRPTLAMIGDAPGGEPEYVLRESTVGKIAGRGGRGSLTVQVIIQGGTIIGSSNEFEEAVAKGLNKGLQRSGEAWGEHERIVKQMVRA